MEEGYPEKSLKGDRFFYENPDLDIKKWFNGLGLSLKVGRFF